MIFMRKSITLLFFIYLAHGIAIRAQSIRENTEDTLLAITNDTSAGKLSLNISTSNFVKDNEYFNRMVEGYTLIGFWAEPTLEYTIGNRTSIRAGLSTVRFFGKDGFYNTEPILSIRHAFTPNISLTMGSLPYSQHGIPDPLLDPERFYLHRVDNGALIQLTASRIYSDTWLSWDRFSFYGDTVQELISAGNGSRITLLNNERFQIQLPIYLIITHRGGQLVRPKQPIETLVNVGSGISLLWQINRLTIELNPNYFLYRKLTSHPSQPFSEGWAIYPVLKLSNNHVVWEAGWWDGHNFIAPKGEKIFTQISTYDNNLTVSNHDVLVNKLSYRAPIATGLQLEAAFESFYLPAEERMDYNFLVHLNWNFTYHLLQLNSKK